MGGGGLLGQAGNATPAPAETQQSIESTLARYARITTSRIRLGQLIKYIRLRPFVLCGNAEHSVGAMIASNPAEFAAL
jgi:hypothetical protein